MKRFLIPLLILTLMFITRASAQNDAHFSFYEYAQNIFNPAAAGGNNAMCVSSIHRQQWVGMEEGRPFTTVFSFDMPIANVVGVALNLNQDRAGFQNDLSVNATGAYRLTLNPGVLSFGVSLGIINRSIDGDWKTPASLNGRTVYEDPNIPHLENATAFDMNFGINFAGEKFWVGASATHLLKPSLPFNMTNRPYIPQHIYLNGGYDFSLPNPSFDILASSMVSYGGSVEIQINAKLLYNKSLWGGVSYRYNDAVSPMIGIHLLNGLSFGYCYDIDLSQISSLNSGSHEILVRYCFQISKNRTAGRYRSVRRL